MQVEVKDIYLTALIFPLGTSWLLQNRGQDELLLLYIRDRSIEYSWDTKQQHVMLVLSLSLIPLIGTGKVISRCDYSGIPYELPEEPRNK